MSPTDPAATPLRLESLTPAQLDLLAAMHEEWRQISSAIGPADRQAAEQGVRQAYQAAGLRPPERIVWLGSPLAGLIAVEMLRNPMVREPDAYWDAVRVQLWEQVRGTESVRWSQPPLGLESHPPAGQGLGKVRECGVCMT